MGLRLLWDDHLLRVAMMAFGIQALGVAGNVQIDQDHVSMSFLAKGSITLDQEISHSFSSSTGGSGGATWGPYGPYFSDAFRSSTSASAGASGGMMTAFRARYATRPVGVLEYFAGGGTTRFVGYSPDATPPIVDWWTFGTPAAETTQFGGVVYDASGARVWTTGGRPMRVVASKNDVVLSGDGAISAGAGDYAICVGKPLGGVRTGSETNIGAGATAWGEGRALWYPPTSTGFATPQLFQIVRRLESFSYPTGWRTGDIRATVLLVDVAGL